MVAFFYFAAAVLVSAAVGLLVRRWQRSLPWGRTVAIGVLLAFVLTVGSGVTFLYAGFAFPATDDPRFRQTNSIYIARETTLPGQADPQRSEMLLQFPFEVQKGRDFEVRLALNSSPSPIAAGDHASTFQGPRVLELRPQRNCPAASDPSSACVRLERPVSEATLVWDVTPTAEADPTARVSIPVFWPMGGTWKAGIKFDGRNVVYSPNPQCARNRWMESVDGGCGPILPLMLDAQRPRFILTSETPTLFTLPYAYRGAEVDLESRQIRFPIRITTSLGLDTNTYAWLALVGTILSGFLGTGWAWKLVELFKPKPVPATTSLQLPPSPTIPEPVPASRPSDNRQKDRQGRRRR